MADEIVMGIMTHLAIFKYSSPHLMVVGLSVNNRIKVSPNKENIRIANVDSTKAIISLKRKVCFKESYCLEPKY